MANPLPNLDLTVQKVKELSLDLSSRSTKSIVDLYLASVALLCHLKADQARLHRAQTDQDAPPLQTQDIPAITAVIQDAKLFRALLRCLKFSTATNAEGVELGERVGSYPSLHQMHMQGRKRSLSFSNPSESDRPNKSIKLTHSPMPGAARQKIDAASGGRTKPSWNVQALAASILYASFQHLDHWPASLVKAYAEDCFGPRSWVDDACCRLLVQNLALTHDGQVVEASEQQLSDAARVADAYLRFESMAFSEDGESSHSRRSPPPLPRRGSLSSTGSGAGRQRSTSSVGSGDDRLVKQPSADTMGDDDSDSGDEEECAINVTISNDQLSKQNGDDSSSGEEDEEVVVTTESLDSEQAKPPPPKPKDSSSTTKNNVGPSSVGGFASLREGVYPSDLLLKVNLEQVRPRFFGKNIQTAHKYICASLVDRLDVKSKQNSRLLKELPSFTAIPRVRSLVASNLEKWLQSPALAGLARALFSSTVNEMKSVDPPLQEDLRTIDSILSMRLKANQFNAHVENVSLLAKRMPTVAVVNHMYVKLFREALDASESADISDELKMIAAVDRVIPPHVSYEAMAASLLLLLANPTTAVSASSRRSRSEQDAVVKKLRALVRLVATELRASFDGCKLLESLLSFDVNSGSWSCRDEEDKARLMFQCATLLSSRVKNRVARNGENNGDSPTAESTIQSAMRRARKLLLTWCCADYGPRCAERSRRKSSAIEEEGDDGSIQPRPPDFSSALGPSTDGEKLPQWLSTMRCLLFLEEADSPQMKLFLSPDGVDDQHEWEEERERIQLCSRYGIVDDEMIWTVLKSTSLSRGGLSPDMSIQLLEHLFESCSKDRNGSLRVQDPMLVWELYNIVEVDVGPEQLERFRQTIKEDEGSEADNVMNDSDARSLPKLASPGLWWRVTALAAVMSGASPKRIGSMVWNEHPTLRACIKMMTSTRYRFPTVDCDDTARDGMKKGEQAARDEEMKIAESMFLPRKQEKEKSSKKLGSRVSKRIQKQQREKEAAKERSELNRRKKLLKLAQKSIMLWNPVGSARKPPREAAELLLAAEQTFGLSEVFQRSGDPDFLLLTVGQTSRDAIERAYDWLIPIISTLPNAIGRLPSSASCFLLLRAYGAEGEERAQLRQLSAPLLEHVRNSLQGSFGESDAVKAFDLLMTDVASRNPDRRRCARRVLKDSLAQEGNAVASTPGLWMLHILSLQHSKALVTIAISHLSKAVSFERERVLRSTLMALEQHFAFAETHGIEVECKFPQLLVRLISNRPAVFAEAMDSFSDLRFLVVRALHAEFQRFADDGEGVESRNAENVVIIGLCGGSSNEVALPLSLLQSISVLLSIWKEGGEGESVADDVTGAVDSLVDALMLSGGEEAMKDESVGLSGARMSDSSLTAVTVESWIMLAKARSDSIAKRAALSAPATFLPRLLLCSGLPRTSLLTMVDRLGRLSEGVAEKDKVYQELLVPSASCEWDIGRVGHRREIVNMLLGRLSAYLRLNKIESTEGMSEVSLTFIDWLSRESRSQGQKPAKSKKKKEQVDAPAHLSSIRGASSLLSSLQDDQDDSESPLLGKNTIERVEFTALDESPIAQPELNADPDAVAAFLSTCLKDSQSGKIDAWLVQRYHRMSTNVLQQNEVTAVDDARLSVLLLTAVQSMEGWNDDATSVVLKWVPVMSRETGSTDLWRFIFSNTGWCSPALPECLLSKCMLSWSRPHVSMCSDWILSSTKDQPPAEYDLARMVKFLVISSRTASPSVESFVSRTANGKDSYPEWCASEAGRETATSIVVECLKQAATDSRGHGVSNRNSLPDCVTLLLFLAKRGGKELQKVNNAILRAAAQSETKGAREALLAALLRVYLCNPLDMKLDTAEIRNALIQAAEAFASVWTTWRSRLDDQLNDMLGSISKGDVKVCRAMADIARKHPLLILRASKQMASILRNDAVFGAWSSSEARGLVVGDSVYNPRPATVAGRSVKVSIRHWGHSYNESIWVSLLEVMTSIPKEVLYGCGPKLGLLDFFAVYLQLVSVQQELRSADRATRLKGKLSDMFTAFKESSKEGWRAWLGSNIEQKEVRHVLMSCEFITPQEAIESLKTT